MQKIAGLLPTRYEGTQCCIFCSAERRGSPLKGILKRQSAIFHYFVVLLFLFIFLFCARIVFWQTYGAGGLPLGAWLSGMRFDAVIATYGACPLILPLLWKRLEMFARVLSGVIVFITVCLVSADYLYFASGGKRLGYEAWVYLNPEIAPIALTAFRQSPLFLTGSLIVTIAIAFLVYLSARAPSSTTPSRRAVWFLALAALSVVLIRGGFQRVPLRIGDSMISSSPLINNAVLNAPFSVISSALVTRAPRVMSTTEARDHALEILNRTGISEDPSLPLLRLFPERKLKKYNVVVILVESFTGALTQAGGSPRDLTPHFDALARDGLVFPKFVASGFRTTSGLFSTLSGMPDTIGVPMMRRPELNRSYSSLSRLLKEQGYKNYFIHGGLLDFDNLEHMLQIEEFDRIEGKSSLEYTNGFKRTWGYADEVGYRHALRMVSETTDPFFLYMLTVSSHAPYEFPSKKSSSSADTNMSDEQKFIDSIQYADSALGEFFDAFRKLPQFANTIFVITGDHTHHGNTLDAWQNQHVPLLLYAPGLIPKGVSDAAGSHVDIVPTLAELLGLPWVASFGRSLLSQPEGTSYFISGLDIGLWDGDVLSFTPIDDKPVRAYQVDSFKAKKVNLTEERLLQLRRRAHSLYQFSMDLVGDDKIAPKRKRQ
jgi:phosphoglycerol transferase MdoB-like AlkP superfamily enzyme